MRSTTRDAVRWFRGCGVAGWVLWVGRGGGPDKEEDLGRGEVCLRCGLGSFISSVHMNNLVSPVENDDSKDECCGGGELQWSSGICSFWPCWNLKERSNSPSYDPCFQCCLASVLPCCVIACNVNNGEVSAGTVVQKMTNALWVGGLYTAMCVMPPVLAWQANFTLGCPVPLAVPLGCCVHYPVRRLGSARDVALHDLNWSQRESACVSLLLTTFCTPCALWQEHKTFEEIASTESEAEFVVDPGFLKTTPLFAHNTMAYRHDRWQ